MLLVGHLAKVQGLKGEFLLHPATDEPDRIPGLKGLLLAPPSVDLSELDEPPGAKQVTIRSFREHKGRPCLAFDQMPDRTAAEPYKGWSLWVPEGSVELNDGGTYRHDWVGCKVYVGGELVGEVLGLVPSPGGYDMVHIRDLRQGKQGVRNVPYINAWFALNLPNHRIDLDPPEGLLDVDG